MDWKGIKRFWSSPAVLKSVYIFAAIAGVMAIIILIATLSGCAGASNYYTKVDRITLIKQHVGRHGNFRTVYMVVANPTSDRRHFIVRCCTPGTTTECLPDEEVVVHPRSDEKVSVNVLSSVSCHLIPASLLDELE